MKSVFDNPERGEGSRNLSGTKLRERILRILEKNGAQSTTDIYVACNKHVRKTNLHEELKKLIGEKLIGFCAEKSGDSVKTTFFLLERKK